jgi:hypothetical protein
MGLKPDARRIVELIKYRGVRRNRYRDRRAGYGQIILFGAFRDSASCIY